RAFALRVLKLSRSLESDQHGRIVGGQLMRSASSVAANYRSVCRCRSHADFVAKLSIVVEEIDESAFWIEFVADIGLMKQDRVEGVLQEADELLAICPRSQHTAR